MAEFTKVAQLSELQAGVGKLVETNGKEVALFNVSGKVYAVTNGVSPVNPRAKITTYEVKVEGNDVFVNV